MFCSRFSEFAFFLISASLFLPEEAPTINVDKNKREYIIHGNTTFHVAPWESRVIPFVMDPSIGKHLLKGFFKCAFLFYWEHQALVSPTPRIPRSCRGQS